MRLLTTLANDASIAIENARLYEQVKDKERLDEDMRIAKMIQLSLLPPSEPDLPDLEIYGIMRPAKEVGGDYYDYIYDKDNKETSIVIGDVSGKGVTAGIFMAMARTIIHSFISAHKNTKEIISHTNAILSKDMGEERFMSMLLMRWYGNQEKFKYTGAGHEHIIIYRKESKSCDVIKSGGLILGVEPDATLQFQEKDLFFNKNDLILLYTDGVTESINQSKKMFGLKRLVDFVEKHGDNSPKDLINILMDEIDKFVDGNIQRDDITLLAIRRK
jgi:serine phosphatase RsbU (regulator of sigma subunit)